MAQAAEVTRRDFDDLVLANAAGDVVWQREPNSPRLGDLRQVLYAESPPRGWLSIRWDVDGTFPNAKPDRDLPRAVAIKEVQLAVRPTLLIVQPVTIAAPNVAGVDGKRDLYLAGVVSREALEDQAMRVPLTWITLFSLPLVLLFLALPFIKLATLRPSERYSLMDAVLLVMAALARAAVGAAIPFMATAVSQSSDEALAKFATKLETSMARDTRAVLDLAGVVTEKAKRERLAAALSDCQVTTGFDLRKCDLWKALKTVSPDTPRSVELDVVAWVDVNGDQQDKWTTKAQVTEKASHAPFEHSAT
jgi:hypothetical protein